MVSLDARYANPVTESIAITDPIEIPTEVPEEMFEQKSKNES